MTCTLSLLQPQAQCTRRVATVGDRFGRASAHVAEHTTDPTNAMSCGERKNFPQAKGTSHVYP